jgi:predicted metal-dependent HD superfamily phosphohydrolase
MYLKPKWDELMEGLEISKTYRQLWWNFILKSYCESKRHYHTIFHIEHMFRQFDRFLFKLTCPVIVQLAIWFHDIVCDSKREDNEAQSASAFLKFAEQCQMSDVNFLFFPKAEYILNLSRISLFLLKHLSIQLSSTPIRVSY